MTTETDIADLQKRVSVLEQKAGITQPAPAPAPKEPTGTDLVSITTLGTGTLTERVGRLPAGKGLTLPPGTFSDKDANRPSNYPVYCIFWQNPTRVLGSGRDVTILQMEPNSLSQTYAQLDTIVEPNPNPYRIIRLDKTTEIADLTIKGTLQGTSAKSKKPYSYHGLQFFATVNPTVRRVRMSDVPGSQGVPPDETFSIEAYKCSGIFTVEDVIVDAPNLPGSSAVTMNGQGTGTLAVSIKKLRVTGHPNGSGWTTFNSKLSSFRAEDMMTDGCLMGINFEHVNVNGGSKVNNALDSGIVLIRPDIRNIPTDKNWGHICVDGSAAAGGVSNRVDIHDPVGVDATHPFKVAISNTYGYASVPWGAQTQRSADIHLWVGTTERNDLLAWPRTKGAA